MSRVRYSDGMTRRIVGMLILLLLSSCARSGEPTGPAPAATPDEARTFLDQVNQTMLRLGTEAGQAGWIASTYITPDSEALNARANQQFIEAVAKFAKDATRFDQLELPADQRRQLNLLKLSLVLVTPGDPKEAEELTRIAAAMEGAYGKGKWCKGEAVVPPTPRPAPTVPEKDDDCLDVEAITEIMAANRDATRLREVWEGWHTIAPPLKKDYVRFVELANKGARELGFADTGAMWRSKYDMPPDEFTKELDRLWEQVRPLYNSLHAYVRMKLRERYGDQIPANGPLPAHLTGNIWAQDWSNVYPLVAPAGADPGFDLNAILKARRMTAVDMVKAGERFYSSVGFAPLPQTFWERSLLAKPRDREVVCHASAWDVDLAEDLRIKMCIDPTAEDFSTIHHELGHNFYQRAYKQQPVLFRDSRERRLPRSDRGHHRAIGDAGVSREDRLAAEGARCLARHRPADAAGALEDRLPAVRSAHRSVALEGVQRRSHAGAVQQGVVGSAAEVSGRRATLAARRGVLRSRCQVSRPGELPVHAATSSRTSCSSSFIGRMAQSAGCTGPLHRCSIYESKEAGTKLNAMLEMGLSPSVARGARSAHRDEADGRHRDPRLLRAAAEVAG